MITCVINVSDYYLYLGVRHMLIDSFYKIAPNKTLNVYKNIRADYDIMFIEPGNLNDQKLINIFESIQLEREVFIITNRELSYHRVNLALKYKVNILFKDEPLDIIISKIQSKISPKLLNLKENSTIDNVSKPLKLTDCERKIIDLVSIGFSGMTIARMLNRSEKTISGHKRSAMRKMGVRSDIELHKLQLISKFTI